MIAHYARACTAAKIATGSQATHRGFWGIAGARQSMLASARPCTVSANLALRRCPGSVHAPTACRDGHATRRHSCDLITFGRLAAFGVSRNSADRRLGPAGRSTVPHTAAPCNWRNRHTQLHVSPGQFTLMHGRTPGGANREFCDD